MPIENANESATEEVEVVLEEAAEADQKPNGAAEADSGAGEGSEQQQSADSDRSGQKELENYSESVQKRIAKLTGKLREAERREQAAIDYAKALKVQQDQVAQRAQSLENSHLYEYNERLKAQEVLLKQSLKAAIDRGDADRQFDAQKALADLAIEQRRYAALEQQRQNAAAQAQQAAAQQQAQPQQQYVQPAPQPDPKAEAWAQRNDWFGKDEAMTVTAFSIHKRLVESEGFDPTSDQYYRELDTRMRKEFPHKFQREQVQAQPRPNTVAPAVRTVQQGNKTTTQVRLTPSQVAIAKKLGVPLEQYARQVAKLNSREG